MDPFNTDKENIMAVVSIKDVVSYYNSVIKSFMDQGYVISPTTMYGGYRGVYGYTDLVNITKKKSFIRIFLIQDYCSDGPYYDCGNYHYYMIRIIAKKYEWDGKIKCMMSANPYFGKLLSEKCFYQIKENRAYTETLDELKQISELRSKRKESLREAVNTKKSYKINKLSAEFIDSIMERINRLHGFKRATASCIEDVRSYVYEDSKGNVRFKGEVICKFNNRCCRIALG